MMSRAPFVIASALSTVALTATSAHAIETPARIPIVQEAKAEPPLDILAQIIPRASRNQIGAKGTVRDISSGYDFVAVQTFIERRYGKRWVIVVTGPRRVGNDRASSIIGLRSCTNGRTYRAKVNYNWNNTDRGTLRSPMVRC